MRLLAIDPGRGKCGLAALDGRVILAHQVVPTSLLIETVRAWAESYRAERIILGDRTGAEAVRQRLAGAFPAIPVTLVAEQSSTLEARRRYFRDHPPRGWRRLLPVSLQVPPDLYDDYAAIIIGERFLAAVGAPPQSREKSSPS